MNSDRVNLNTMPESRIRWIKGLHGFLEVKRIKISEISVIYKICDSDFFARNSLIHNLDTYGLKIPRHYPKNYRRIL